LENRQICNQTMPLHDSSHDFCRQAAAIRYDEARQTCKTVELPDQEAEFGDESAEISNQAAPVRHQDAAIRCEGVEFSDKAAPIRHEAAEFYAKPCLAHAGHLFIPETTDSTR
jgi:hypothetical protein